MLRLEMAQRDVDRVNADVTQIRDALVGIWVLDAAGMQSQVTLSPDGQYSSVLAGGAQGHSGTWAVSNNVLGGQTIVFAIKDAFPQTFVGPLGSVPITWPKSESWNITGIQPNQVLIQGGGLRRIDPAMAATGAWPGAGTQRVPPFPGMMTMPDMNAEAEKEMRQIADAGRKVFGTLKNVWSAFKKR